MCWRATLLLAHRGAAGMGPEVGSGWSGAGVAGAGPGTGSPWCYCPALAWGRKGSACWLIPLSQELTELGHWQGHRPHRPWIGGLRRCLPCWPLPGHDAGPVRERVPVGAEVSLPGWWWGHRNFSEPLWRSPYHFIKGCYGFFGVRLSVAWTTLNTAWWIWAPALAPPKPWSQCWSRLWPGAHVYFRYRALRTCLSVCKWVLRGTPIWATRADFILFQAA